MRVTVYLPPYLVGLKMSDWTLANATHRLHMLITKLQCNKRVVGRRRTSRRGRRANERCRRRSATEKRLPRPMLDKSENHKSSMNGNAGKGLENRKRGGLGSIEK